MWKKGVGPIVAVVGLISFLLTPKFRPHLYGGQNQVGHSAFTATVLVRYYDETNKLGRAEVWIEATRADWSAARVHEITDGRVDPVRTFVDVSLAERFSLDPLSKSVTTYHFNPKELRSGVDPMSTCRIEGETSQDSLLGFPVIHYRSRDVFGPRVVEDERWVAPSLGCYTLKRSYNVFEAGQKIGRTTGEALSVTLGDPDPSLFVVPTDYIERSPSEVMALRAQLTGKKCAPCEQKSAPALDAVYEARQR